MNSMRQQTCAMERASEFASIAVVPPTPTGQRTLWTRVRVSFLGGIEDPPYLREYFDGLIPDGAGYGDLL